MIKTRGGSTRPAQETVDRKKNEIVTASMSETVTAHEIGNKIREQRRESNCKTYEFKGQSFYYDNPDTTVHDVVRRIFEVCELGD